MKEIIISLINLPVKILIIICATYLIRKGGKDSLPVWMNETMQQVMEKEESIGVMERIRK